MIHYRLFAFFITLKFSECCISLEKNYLLKWRGSLPWSSSLTCATRCYRMPSCAIFGVGPNICQVLLPAPVSLNSSLWWYKVHPCPIGFVHISSGECHLFKKFADMYNNSSRSKAADNCGRLNAKLSKLRVQNNFITDFVSVASSAGCKILWIDGERRNGTWYWYDNEHVNFSLLPMSAYQPEGRIYEDYLTFALVGAPWSYGIHDCYAVYPNTIDCYSCEVPLED